ncbi:hypothetical protein DL96DRAFT_1702399 [Flagelloscypha sp. PMI_526]|nr:hypothetical protein DL96DRAFT_1702399 [Flagelloscypha sp. PMI_526]
MNASLKRSAVEQPSSSSQITKIPRLDVSYTTPRQQMEQARLGERWKSASSTILQLLKDTVRTSVDYLQSNPTSEEASMHALDSPTASSSSQPNYLSQRTSSRSVSAASMDAEDSPPTSIAPSFTFSTTNRSFSNSTAGTTMGNTASVDEKLSQALARLSETKPSTRLPHKEHIYHRRYRQGIEDLRQEEQRSLRLLHKGVQTLGYSSSSDALAHFLIYKDRVRQLEAKELRRSPSAPDLSARYGNYHHPRRHSDDGFRRDLTRVLRSLNTSQPSKVWSPTSSQLDLLNRTRDEAVEARLRPKRPPLPSHLPPDDEKQVTALFQRRGVISKFARESVSHDDLARLKPGTWINDELINFYGAMIMSAGTSTGNENVQPNSPRPLNVHYFSTFFWPKLTKDGYDKGRLAKWTKKIDLFSKDAVLIAHTTAWGGPPSDKFKFLRRYLDSESRDKKKKPFDFTDWEDFVHPDTPQQENHFDCGVFTLQTLLAVSRGDETFNFSQKDMPYIRRRMVWEIGNGRLWDLP